MWRLWTKGWGPRSWVYWVQESIPMWLAFWLPRKIALWAFIRVTGNWSAGPGKDYEHIYKAWENK